MYSFPVPLRHGLAILLSLVVSTMAHAQQVVVASLQQDKSPPPRAAEPSSGSVHRIVILEGANRRVDYITTGNLSTSDRTAAYNLARAENELALLSDLQQLKRQYINNERAMEARRHVVQMELYGRRISTSNYSTTGVNYSPYSSYGYPGGIYGYYGAGAPASYYPFSYGGNRSGGSAISSVNTSSYSEVRGLQFGMGDEGRMKNAIVQVIATQFAPEYIDKALHSYQAAVDAAAASPVLSRDLGLTRSKKSSQVPSAEPSFAEGKKVTVWVGKDKYVGTVKDDRFDWVVLQTDKGEVSVRKAEITR